MGSFMDGVCYDLIITKAQAAEYSDAKLFRDSKIKQILYGKTRIPDELLKYQGLFYL